MGKLITMQLRRVCDFASSEKIVKEIYELTAPSYIDNTAIVKREIEHCNEIYLLYNSDEMLVAFFMVNFERLEDMDTCYLGLSTCHHNYKGYGYAKYLYNSFFMDCKMREASSAGKVLCWWTTASPIPYQWFNKNVDDCQPDMEGNISEATRKLMIKIAAQKYSHIQVDESRPFILNKVAKTTNYSLIEKNKLKQVQDKLKISVFDRFPIDESNGDRYLMTGFAPSIDILKKRLCEEIPGSAKQ
jgi:hypothetical protein